MLDGHSLDLEAVVAVAREGARVELAADAVDRMGRSRRVLERFADAGQPVYGYSTGVGALKRVAVGRADARAFNLQMVLNCRVGQGPPAAPDVVRATLVRLANNFARGVVGVRPELAQLVVRALNEDWSLHVRTRGSVGEADLAPLADLTAGLLDREGFVLEAGEGLAILDNNAFSTAIGALAMADAICSRTGWTWPGRLTWRRLLPTRPRCIQCFASVPIRGCSRWPARLRELLAGSWLWDPGVPATCRIR